MLFSRSKTRVTALALLLAACGETPSPTEDDGGTGGGPVGGSAGVSGAPQGGTSAAGSPSTGGSVQGGSGPTGGTAGSAPAGAGGGGNGGAGLAGGGAGGATGGEAGVAGGAGAAGQGGAAGGAGAAGGGSGGASGNGGAAGGGTGGKGGAAGSGGAGGKGGAAGSAGSGGAGGATAYNPCPAAPAPCVILPFGDSITDGFGTPGGYRIDLFRTANTANRRITFVGSLQNGPTMVDGVTFPRSHEGHSGWAIDTLGGLTGISPLVPAAIGRNPDIVLLMIGTNDLNGNVQVANAPTRLGNLLDSITNASSRVLVVVARIVPGRQDSLNTRIRAYNDQIPGLVSSRTAMGKHIVSVNMYAAFTRDANYKTTLLADDLHPTPAGYARMAETWYAAVGGLFR